MSRHKKPIPPDFRLAVREGLGYHRLKKRFGVGGSTISRWLDECGLRTHNAPSPGLGSFNQSQALSRRFKIKERVQEAIDQENTRRWASLVAKMEQPKMNTGQSETRTGQPVKAGGQPTRGAGAAQDRSNDDELDGIRSKILQQGRKMGLLDNWDRVIQLVQALQSRFKTHDERRPIMEAAGIQMRTYLKGAARPLGIRVLTRFVNGGDVCTEEPSAEALLFYLLAGQGLVANPSLWNGNENAPRSS